jgi:hypothetical protein
MSHLILDAPAKNLTTLPEKKIFVKFFGATQEKNHRSKKPALAFGLEVNIIA